MPAAPQSPVENPLAHWRAEFPIFERTIYLNSCSLGALARGARAQVELGLDQWESRGAANWYDAWWRDLDQLRTEYADVIGAAACDIALHSSVSNALGVLGSGLDTSRRRRIVTTALDFPTLPYQWLPKDVDVVLLESPDGITVPLERFAQAIDTNTALVATSHVYFTSGAIQDVAAIATMAHAAGALSLVDGYQAAGQVPVDVMQLGVDFYLSGGLKWLLGGPGITFLYARPDTTRSVVPTAPGWFAHRDQFAFDPRQFTPHDDARRFEAGTPAIMAVKAQLGGLAVLREAGAAAIRTVTSALTEDLVRLAINRGLKPRVAPSASERSAIVMLPRADPRADVARLGAAGYIVDMRPGHVRVSPYFYNVADDHRGLIEVLLDG